MACTDVTQTDEDRCPSCGHPASLECQCDCCATGREADFAAHLASLALSVAATGDQEMATYLEQAADWHQVRSMLTAAGLERIEG
jgi:hypothetical protein